MEMAHHAVAVGPLDSFHAIVNASITQGVAERVSVHPSCVVVGAVRSVGSLESPRDRLLKNHEILLQTECQSL